MDQKLCEVCEGEGSEVVTPSEALDTVLEDGWISVQYHSLNDVVYRVKCYECDGLGLA